jgi:hypothetical protein
MGTSQPGPLHGGHLTLMNDRYLMGSRAPRCQRSCIESVPGSSRCSIGKSGLATPRPTAECRRQFPRTAVAAGGNRWVWSQTRFEGTCSPHGVNGRTSLPQPQEIAPSRCCGVSTSSSGIAASGGDAVCARVRYRRLGGQVPAGSARTSSSMASPSRSTKIRKGRPTVSRCSALMTS